MYGVKPYTVIAHKQAVIIRSGFFNEYFHVYGFLASDRYQLTNPSKVKAAFLYRPCWLLFHDVNMIYMRSYYKIYEALHDLRIYQLSEIRSLFLTTWVV